MEIDDYKKQRPALGGGQNKYTCAICRNGFAAPKRKFRGTYHLLLALGIILIIGGMMGNIEMFFGGLLVIVIYLPFPLLGVGSKKVCPICGAENIYKNR